MERWTKESLENLSDLDFAIAILNERKDKVSNFHSPLYQKLNRATLILQCITTGGPYMGKNLEDYYL